MDSSTHRLQEILGPRGTRWLEDLIQQLPEGVLLFDEDKHILVSNPAAMAILRAMDTDSATDPSAPPVVALMERVLDHHHEEAHLVLELAAPPGRAFKIRAFPLSLETHQRHWMALLRESTQDRDEQRRLEQQGRLAAIGQLAAGISHDFNNLLTGILGYAELMAYRSEAPPEILRDAEAICRLGRQASQLVRQILDFSRQIEPRRCTVDLAASLRTIHDLLLRILPSNIILRLALPAGEYHVLANPIGLQQIVTSLALNARDAMPRGGSLCLSLRRQLLSPDHPRPLQSMPDGVWAVVRAEDTGCGMEPRVLDRVFEPFFTTKKAGAGTGLGLSQAYGIVKQQDGYIFAESVPSEGSTFTVWLPLQVQTSAAIQRGTVEQPLPMGHGETVLLVEDEREVREVLQQMLTQLGYGALCASSGAEALSLFEAHRSEIALVLTDMMMPGMSGTELFHALRRRDATVKIIVLSGYPKDQVADSEAVWGVDGWLRKPPDLVSLGTLLSGLLGSW